MPPKRDACIGPPRAATPPPAEGRRDSGLTRCHGLWAWSTGRTSAHLTNHVGTSGSGPSGPTRRRRPRSPSDRPPSGVSALDPPARIQRCNVAWGIASSRARSVSSHSCSLRTSGSPTASGRGPVRPRRASKTATMALVNVAERFGGWKPSRFNCSATPAGAGPPRGARRSGSVAARSRPSAGIAAPAAPARGRCGIPRPSGWSRQPVRSPRGP